jgi:hypothetical protein
MSGNLVAGPSLYNYFILPAASASGQFGTYFRTDVYLVNPYPWKSVTVRMWFLRAGQDNNSAPSRDIVIPAGGTATLPDVLQNTFGVSGSGAVLVDSINTSSSAYFLASSRTYTSSASGSYGLASEGISDFNDGGAESLISGVRNGGGFRTNTAVVSSTGTTLSLRVDAYNTNGQLMGSRSVALPPFGQQQVALTDFASAFDYGYVVWTCLTTSGSIGWAAYATAIDNASGDSTFLLDRLDDAFVTYRNSFNLAGRWTGIGVLGNGGAGNVRANVYQNGPLLRMYLYDATTGEQIVYLRGYENQGSVRLTGGGTNYSCLGYSASGQFVASATQISGGVSGTGCFSIGGVLNITKQSSFVLGENEDAERAAHGSSAGVRLTPPPSSN